MSVQKIIEEFENAQQAGETKTAQSHAGADLNRVHSARTELASALHGTQKTAQQGSVDPNQLEKIAAQLVEAEHAASVKEAQLFGAAAFSGFLAEADRYARATQGQRQKTAAAAQEDAMIKQAAYKGAQDIDMLLGGRQKTAAANAAQQARGNFQASLEKLASGCASMFNYGVERMGVIHNAVRAQG